MLRRSFSMPTNTRRSNDPTTFTGSESICVPGQRLSQNKQITGRYMSEVVPLTKPHRLKTCEPLTRHVRFQTAGHQGLSTTPDKLDSARSFKVPTDKLVSERSLKVAQALTVRALKIKGVSRANIAHAGLSVEAIDRGWGLHDAENWEKNCHGKTETEHLEDNPSQDPHDQKLVALDATSSPWQTERQVHDTCVLSKRSRWQGLATFVRSGQVKQRDPTATLRTQTSFRWETPFGSEKTRRIATFVVLSRTHSAA